MSDTTTDSPPAVDAAGYPLAPVYEGERVVLYHGDCLNVLRRLPDASVHAVVTDPPYGLNFMGRAWDRFEAEGVEVCEECGDDAPAQGYRYCTDCMEALDAERDAAAAAGAGMLGQLAANRAGKGAHTRGYADNNNAAFQRWVRSWAAECHRVLTPGGHLVAFGGSRTWHRLAAGIEDAGFEIRDSIAWLYGTGFPKSRNVTDAMQAHVAGDELARQLIRPGVYEVTGFLRDARDRAGWTNKQIDALFGTTGMSGHWTSKTSQPAVPSVRQWEVLKQHLGFGDSMDELVAELGSTERPDDWGTREQREEFLAALRDGTPTGEVTGWGTALKPAFEPIVVARKQLAGTVAATVTVYGTGALNIDGTRIPMSEEDREKFERGSQAWQEMAVREGQELADGSLRKPTTVYGDYGTDVNGPHDAGRWPPNVILTHSWDCEEDGPCVPGCPVLELDTSTADLKGAPRGVYGQQRGDARGKGNATTSIGPRKDGDGIYVYGDAGGASRFLPVFRWHSKADGRERPKAGGITHPTVKPLGLMRWLARLVTPPGGKVLEPFGGSGTTGEACLLEGFEVVIIEKTGEYLPLIRERILRQVDPVAYHLEEAADDPSHDPGLFGLLAD